MKQKKNASLAFLIQYFPTFYHSFYENKENDVS